MGIIKAAKLAFDYLRYDEDGNVEATQRAVDGGDLDIQAGEFVAVLGHNGSGKSTFAKHINALLLPTEGTIWIDGIDTSKESELWKVRQKAGMVFQNPDNQIIGNIVEEDVGFGPENIGVETKEIWKRVDESLKAVGMTAYRKQSPNKLSGGQKQRVAIAGVMALRPKVLILDEPTAGLDPKGREDILREIRRYHKETGRTVLLVSHSMEDMANCAEKILVMNAGKVFCYDTVENVFRQAKALQEIGLAVPQITRVCMQLREQGIPLSDDIYTVEAAYQQILQLYRQQKEGTGC